LRVLPRIATKEQASLEVGMHVRILRVVFTWAVFTSLSWWNVSVNSAIEENGQGTEEEPETSGPLSLGVSDKSERVMLRSA